MGEEIDRLLDGLEKDYSQFLRKGIEPSADFKHKLEPLLQDIMDNWEEGLTPILRRILSLERLRTLRHNQDPENTIEFMDHKRACREVRKAVQDWEDNVEGLP